MLKELAKLVQQQVRTEDIACRYGGEEFVMILPGAPLAVARERAEALRLQSEQLAIEHRGQPLGSTTLSLGVAGYPEHGATREALIKSADVALYRAKRGGRNQTVVAGAGA